MERYSPRCHLHMAESIQFGASCVWGLASLVTAAPPACTQLLDTGCYAVCTVCLSCTALDRLAYYCCSAEDVLHVAHTQPVPATQSSWVSGTLPLPKHVQTAYDVENVVGLVLAQNSEA